jgi:membrane associated rhomboid family serine protease
MQILPYWVIGALVVIGLAVAIVGGGAFWIAAVIGVTIALAYAVVDRRMKRRQGHGERLSSELHPDR